MSEAIIVFFFGFPAAFVSLLVSAVGVLKGKYWLVLLGAVLFIPFSYYLYGSPGLYGLPILLPMFQILSAAAVREGNKSWAWILLLPPAWRPFGCGSCPVLSDSVNHGGRVRRYRDHR